MTEVDTGGPFAVETSRQSGERIQSPNCMTERIKHLEDMFCSFCSPIQAEIPMGWRLRDLLCEMLSRDFSEHCMYSLACECIHGWFSDSQWIAYSNSSIKMQLIMLTIKTIHDWLLSLLVGFAWNYYMHVLITSLLLGPWVRLVLVATVLASQTDLVDQA